MSAGYKSINLNKFVDPLAASQASGLFSAEYNAAADRTVQTQFGEEGFDATLGVLGPNARRTPALGGGGFTQPLFDPKFQMVRDWQYNTSYLNAIGSQPVTSYNQDIDALTAAGTKYRTTRDANLVTQPENTLGYINNIDPIQKCAAGEQLMLLRAAGSAGGVSKASSSIPDAYVNQSLLRSSSRLTGVSAGEPSQLQYSDAYNVRPMASAALPKAPVAQPYSSLSLAGFSSAGSLNVP